MVVLINHMTAHLRIEFYNACHGDNNNEIARPLFD